MGLAVVYNRLLVAVEGQCTHLMGDLFRRTVSIKEMTEGVCDGEQKGQVEETGRHEGAEGRKGKKREQLATQVCRKTGVILNVDAAELSPFKVP